MLELTPIQKLEYIFDTLEETKTSIVAFAKASKISRATIHAWKRGDVCGDMIRLEVAYNEARKLWED